MVEAHIAELDHQIQQTDTVKGLQEGQERMIESIQLDREENKKAFDKGAEKFDDLYEKVDEMKQQISEGFKDIKDTITENEISKLKKELDKRDEQKQTQDSKSWDLAKIALTAIFAVITTALLFKFGIQ